MSSNDAVVSVLWNAHMHRERYGAHRVAPPSLATLLDHVEPEHRDGVPRALEELQRDGWIAPSGGGWLLVPSRHAEARAIHQEVSQAYFASWMLRSDDSPASRRYCEVVYGTGLVHFNMVDAAQLAALHEALGLRPGDAALDLGCATGTLTEHLAVTSGAHVHGVDFARAAIDRARALRGVATYEVANLDDLVIPAATYDAIVAFDTLYFVEDLHASIARCAAGLRSGGRLAAFWSETLQGDAPSSRLQPDGTRLADALRGAGLAWTTREFSDEERALWSRAQEVLGRLEAEFVAEGAADLWESRREEAERSLQGYDAGRRRRYLYVARHP